MRYYSEITSTHEKILEHHVPELAAESLSSKMDHIEILKNSVSILANLVEKICESEKPRHKMMLNKDIIKGYYQLFLNNLSVRKVNFYMHCNL